MVLCDAVDKGPLCHPQWWLLCHQRMIVLLLLSVAHCTPRFCCCTLAGKGINNDGPVPSSRHECLVVVVTLLESVRDTQGSPMS
jgi:hypothetical protein